MRFFERQRQARRRSGLWLLAFGLAAAFTVFCLQLLIWLCTGVLTAAGLTAVINQRWDVFFELLLGVSIYSVPITVGLIAIISLARMRALGDSGVHILQSFGARVLHGESLSMAEVRARNCLEEMAIASGMPVPTLLVFDDEPAINAVTVGWSRLDAGIAITRGALLHLPRDEMQGLLGHEFALLANGDTRLDVILMGCLYGLEAPGLLGQSLMGLNGPPMSSHDQREAAPWQILGAAILIVGLPGLAAARSVKAFLGREREALGDAAAVQYTRHGLALADALKTVAAHRWEGRVAQDRATHFHHMLFVDGLGTTLLPAHAPLMTRIQRWDPVFNEADLASRRERVEADLRAALAAQANPMSAAVADDWQASEPDDEPQQPAAQSAGQAVLPEALQEPLAAFGDALDPTLYRSLHEPIGAMAALLLLLDNEASAAVLSRLQSSSASFADSLSDQATALTGHMPADWRARLTVMELGLGGLREGTRAQLQGLLQALRAHEREQAQDDFLTVITGRMLAFVLRAMTAPQRQGSSGRQRLFDLRESVRDWLALLAGLGHEDKQAAGAAFEHGWDWLFQGQPCDYQAPPGHWPQQFDRSLQQLQGLREFDRELLLSASLAVIDYDHQRTAAEQALAFMLSILLEQPLPRDTNAEQAETLAVGSN